MGSSKPDRGCAGPDPVLLLVPENRASRLHLGIRYPQSPSDRRLLLVLGRPAEPAGPEHRVVVQTSGSGAVADVTLAPGTVHTLSLAIGTAAGQCMVRATGESGEWCEVQCHLAELRTEGVRLTPAEELPPGAYGREVAIALLNARIETLNAHCGDVLRAALRAVETCPAMELTVPAVHSTAPARAPRLLVVTAPGTPEPFGAVAREVACLRHYASDRGFRFEVAAIPATATGRGDALSGPAVSGCRAIVVAGPRGPGIFEVLRNASPDAVLLYRAPHGRPETGAHRRQLHENDIGCARAADFVLVPDDESSRRYRAIGIAEARLLGVPYYSPDEETLAAAPPELRPRACLGVVFPEENDGLDLQGVLRLAAAVRGAGWSLALSVPPGFRRRVLETVGGVPGLEGVAVLPQSSDPVSTLAGFPVVAMLSARIEHVGCLVVDAVAADSRILLPEPAFRAVTADLRPWCRPADQTCGGLWQELASGTPGLPSRDLSRSRRRRAFLALDAAFGLNSVRPAPGPSPE